MNLKEEIDKIMNEISVDDVDLSNTNFDACKSDMTEQEHKAKMLEESLELMTTLAKGMKIALTGKDGFKTLDEFDELCRDFNSCIRALMGAQEHLARLMFKKVEKAPEDEHKEFMSRIKKEAIKIMIDELKQKMEEEK